jgi:lipoate-protein ligase A
VGSAQRCENRTILQHGSILIGGSQDDVARIARVPFQLNGRATTLRDLMPAVPDISEIAAAIMTGFEELGGTRLAPPELSGSVAARANELVTLYSSAEWTWRR